MKNHDKPNSRPAKRSARNEGMEAKEAVLASDGVVTRLVGNNELAKKVDATTESGPMEVATPEGSREWFATTFNTEVEPLPTTELRRGNISALTRPGAFPIAGHPVGGTRVSEYLTDPLETAATTEHCFAAQVDEENPSSSDDIDRPTEMYEGQIVPDANQQRSSKMGWLAIASAGLIGILVILLIFLLPKNSAAVEEDEAMMADPVQSHPSANNAPFSNDIPELVVTSIKYDRHSPFYHANIWLLKDPSLESYSLLRKKQRFFLAMLFYASNGNNWTNNYHWLSYNVSECEWFSHSSYTPDSPYYEPRICDSNGTMINLSLADNNLDGPLPIWYTSFLPFLEVLDLTNNNIGGQLPVVTTSEYLKVLAFSFTGFTGKPILNVQGYFVNLKVLEWVQVKTDGNTNGGLFPMVPNLEVYDVSGILHTLPFPTNIGTLTHLQKMGLGDNDSTGKIPSELGLLTELVHLDLSLLPHLSGSLPSELGQLTKLTQLDLAGTPLTGTVPANLCNLVTDGLLSMRANCSLLECCF